MTEVNRENLKKWALAIVTEVEPDDAFVVEDGFEALVEEWHRADAQEGRFIGGAEVATFAAMVAPFLLAFFGDVAKDVVKDRVTSSTLWANRSSIGAPFGVGATARGNHIALLPQVHRVWRHQNERGTGLAAPTICCVPSMNEQLGGGSPLSSLVTAKD